MHQRQTHQTSNKAWGTAVQFIAAISLTMIAVKLFSSTQTVSLLPTPTIITNNERDYTTFAIPRLWNHHSPLHDIIVKFYLTNKPSQNDEWFSGIEMNVWTVFVTNLKLINIHASPRQWIKVKEEDEEQFSVLMSYVTLDLTVWSVAMNWWWYLTIVMHAS